MSFRARVVFATKSWKLDLITKMNGEWKDLSEDWIDRRELDFSKTLDG